MNTLSIDLGVNEYQLAPDCIVRFNPTDAEFINKLYHGIEAVGKADEAYKKRLEGCDDGLKVLEEMKKADTEIREIIDGVFDAPVCQGVFGDMHVTARSSHGIPVSMELFMSIIDQCDIDITGLNGTGKTYVDKYTKKYLKKYGK